METHINNFKKVGNQERIQDCKQRASNYFKVQIAVFIESYNEVIEMIKEFQKII